MSDALQAALPITALAARLDSALTQRGLVWRRDVRMLLWDRRDLARQHSATIERVIAISHAGLIGITLNAPVGDVAALRAHMQRANALLFGQVGGHVATPAEWTGQRLAAVCLACVPNEENRFRGEGALAARDLLAGLAIGFVENHALDRGELRLLMAGRTITLAAEDPLFAADPTGAPGPAK